VDEELLKQQVQEKLSAMGGAEIIVGIPSYNNADTIGQVARAAQEGLQKYFPARKSLIVNSDGGSKDGTIEALDQPNLNAQMILSVNHPLYPVHHLMALTVVAALDELGISRITIIVTFAIVLGGLVTAAAIALGLGARELARDLLQSQFRPKVRPEAEDPLRHL
jgi:hypothetical protein